MSTKFHESTQKIDALQCFYSRETEKLKLIVGHCLITVYIK